MSKDNKELSEALDKIDMEYWLNREAVDYKVTRGARGAQLNIKECPVCGNSKWKVYLNQDNGLGNCFSGDCEAKFNKWSFIKNSLGNLVNKQTVEHIKAVAKEQGWTPVVRTAITTTASHDTLKYPKSVSLPINGRNLKYLINRKIDNDLTQHFGLRFCQRGAFFYDDVSGERRSQSYDNRIIIPIFNLEGELVSYQGRDITGLAEKKYLFPPGFAATGAYLYNGQNAYGCIEATIGEGVFDVMAIRAAFDEDAALRNVAAIGSFGKNLSHGGDNTQLAELLKLKDVGLKRVTFMWDGEPAAIKAAIETALIVRGHGIIARVALLPLGLDPNEATAKVVRDAYWNAVTISEAEATKLLIRLGV